MRKGDTPQLKVTAHFSDGTRRDVTPWAKFDSTDEVRLVDGWNGEVYDKFADKFTIWSNGKFNLNSFDEDMHRALIRASALTQPSDATLDMCFVQLKL